MCPEFPSMDPSHSPCDPTSPSMSQRVERTPHAQFTELAPVRAETKPAWQQARTRSSTSLAPRFDRSCVAVAVTAPGSRLDALNHRRGAHPLRVGCVPREALIHDATPGHIRLLDVSRHDRRNAVRAERSERDAGERQCLLPDA